jgi:hypothetical protein
VICQKDSGKNLGDIVESRALIGYNDMRYRFWRLQCAIEVGIAVEFQQCFPQRSQRDQSPRPK